MHNTFSMHSTINDDAVKAIQKIMSYFIQRITIKANEYCHMNKRKTVTAEDILWATVTTEDILWAMNNVGLNDYVELENQLPPQVS
ncbi:hypothetical protein P3S68_005389 [Capsicum galapagoense]